MPTATPGWIARATAMRSGRFGEVNAEPAARRFRRSRLQCLAGLLAGGRRLAPYLYLERASKCAKSALGSSGSLTVQSLKGAAYVLSIQL